jgi:hypothetical protein
MSLECLSPENQLHLSCLNPSENWHKADRDVLREIKEDNFEAKFLLINHLTLYYSSDFALCGHWYVV